MIITMRILSGWVLLVSFLTLLTPLSAQKISREQSFNQHWKFSLNASDEASSVNYDDSAWRMLDLPHDWSVEGSFDAKAPAGNDGGYLPTGKGWYRKAFQIPVSWQGKQLLLHFDGVYNEAKVYVNGRLVLTHSYGYTPFYVDITPYVQFGASNLIAVSADNSQQKNCRWYSGSGIYRSVTLTVTNQIHFSEWSTAITTPQITSEKASVEIRTSIQNETAMPQDCKVTVVLRDANHKKVGSSSAVLALPAQTSKETQQLLTLPSPQLWGLDHPHLYRAVLSIEQNGKTMDEIEIPFGVRSITYSAEKGLQLNGNTILLNGGCVHHDNGCLGAAAFPRAEERRVELLKQAGFNAVRTSHNPPSKAFLDACDRLGLLVMDEAFDGWRTLKNTYDYSILFDAHWKEDVSAMVLRDRNHPSIFCWSIGNEIIERKSPEAIVSGKNLAEQVHQLDPTRPVTSAMTTWDKEWQIFDSLFAVHDIAGYNYQIHRAESDHQRMPERMIIQTESYPREAFQNWALVNDHDYIFGDFVWTAIDYLGESGIGRYFYEGETRGEHYQRDQYPWHGAYCGDIDLTGWRKPISHYRSMLYHPEGEKLYLAVKEPDGYYGKINETTWSVWPTWESWTWPGYEGSDIQVEVYSHYPRIRLYLNNRLVKDELTGRNEAFKAVVTLPYETGILKVTGVDEAGREVETRTLQTAGEVARMQLTADRSQLLADGQDLSFVTVELYDAQGVRQPNATNRLSFSVEGEGAIVGVDNALLNDNDKYTAHERNAWKGRVMVVIRSTNNPGKVVLHVQSEGLPEAQLVLRSK